jgi:hypothetical protein
MSGTKKSTPTIEVYAVEQRTMIHPGQPSVTITRETVFKNGKGRKTVRVTRGNRIMSDVTRRLNRTEKRKVHKRKYVKGLYTPLENTTMTIMNRV